MDSENFLNKKNFVISIVILILILFLGLLLFFIGVAEYTLSREIMNHFSLDGSMDSFTESIYFSYRFLFLITGVVFFILASLGFIFISHFRRLNRYLFLKMKQSLKSFWIDLKQIWFDLKHPGFEKWEWFFLVGIILLAFIGRWIWVERPMMHDESYTFIAFAKTPLVKIISNYQLPNNHVFNSILIHLVYSILGNSSPMIVRLPSLLAGVLCVLLVYIWQRKENGIYTAIIASALVSFFPWLKLQSTNGRGYMIMAMFTLMMLILANRVRIKKDKAAWVFLTITTVLNFYTLPIALYPFGIIISWLFVSAIRGQISKEYGCLLNFYKYMIFFGVSSGILTLLLYLPIFLIGSGWNSFFNNPFVESLDWKSFVQTLPVRLTETIQEWQLGLPTWYFVLLCIGVVLSIIFHRKTNDKKTSIQLCTIITLVIIFIVQRPNPWARIWSFLLPMLLAWAAGGWFLLIKVFFRNRNSIESIQKWFMYLLLNLTLILSITHIATNLQYYKGELGQEETVTLAVKQILTADDIVFTSTGWGPAFWYYFDLHNMPLSTIIDVNMEQDWQSIFFVVDDRENNDPIELIGDKKINSTKCNMEALQMIYEYGHYQVIECSNNNG